MMSKKELIMELLKGGETGDPEAATVVNEAKYIQHNLRTDECAPALLSCCMFGQGQPAGCFHARFRGWGFCIRP